ncbi:Aspartyl/glutamyl-tRNA(Asn/Gln) amidotransferase subunit B [uncultured delta proteobacterium]|uniref:Aspartyl/glutamyl-tRNA(Asn/Gln) amidotransferase subunit B n=1 Tax=uncultured delta proteobacterium TaxID=34034 RepID=A0A212J7C6_9DELT|nr:Aspartyl/glutamyl-tRNA(Asn/Gln) amidotransferase subunit B [uncultured delta proteobacterium]
MPAYEAVIGLEVHAQLATESKLFCSCANHFGDSPNENVCAICAGMPGALPVLNKKAVEFAAKMGMAINCAINEYSVFARKNYFYPDLPDGFQTSQFDPPICVGGHLDIPLENGSTRRVRITRIHMENDAGKCIHPNGANVSLVDLNRGGTPLIEIVTEPDLRSATEAAEFVRRLRAILLYLGVCDGNMEEGSLRCDANVSIRPEGSDVLNTRVEIKNLNSFRNVQKAIEYEIARQRNCYEDGETFTQETRLFDTEKGVTQSMRSKEEAHDYRYFPNPDLPPVVVSREDLARWKSELPELPDARKVRFMKEYELSEQDADILTSEKDLADFFEKTVGVYAKPKRIANLMQSELLRELNAGELTLRTMALTPEGLAELARIIEEGLISVKIAQDIFPDLFTSGGSPEALVRERGLAQISDTGALEAAVADAVAANPDEAAKYKAGNVKLMSFFVGQVMRRTGGKANPALVNELLKKHLG